MMVAQLLVFYNMAGNQPLSVIIALVGRYNIHFPYYGCGEVGIGHMFKFSTFLSIVIVTCIYNGIAYSRVSHVDGEKSDAYTIFHCLYQNSIMYNRILRI